MKKRVINTQVGQQPVVVSLAADGQTFRAFSRQLKAQTLTFTPVANGQLTDRDTGTSWTKSGLAAVDARWGLSGTLAFVAILSPEYNEAGDWVNG